ncbi:MAG: hypothetical protein HY681_01110 [Chloroflexi bacterium]|nr:hypothetical protein [Chloroflexota bacterium]
MANDDPRAHPTGQAAEAAARGRFARFVAGLAAAIGLDGLLLLPVLFLVDARPGLMWPALAAYVAATLAVLAGAGLLLRRMGILARGPWPPRVYGLAVLAVMAVVGLVTGVVIAPQMFLVLVLAYLWALGYAAYAALRQSALE